MAFRLWRRSGPNQFERLIAALDGRNRSAVHPVDVTAVLACVAVICDAVAVPELHVMRRDGDRRERAENDPRYRLLNRRPNEFQTSLEFRQMMTAIAALHEEAIAIPTRLGRNNELIEIIPVLPAWIQQKQVERYGATYRLADENGPIGTFRSEDLLIIRSHTTGLSAGLNVVKAARAAINLAAAAEYNLVTLHENGGRPSGILTTDQTLSEVALTRLKTAFANVTRGEGRGGIAALDGGLSFTPLAMTAVDAQALETRRLQVEEICRAFGVFPIMVGHSDKTSTFASAEAHFAAHNRKTVLRWQKIWAQRIDEFLLDGSGPLFVRFENEFLKLAPLRDQAEYFARALGSGGGVPWMTQNEVRSHFDLNPVDDGDVIRDPVASTMAPAEQADEGGSDEI